jgi:MFS family permease
VSTTEHADDWSRLSLLMGCMFGIVGMGSSAVAVALPAMSGDLGLDVGASAWTVSLYVLMLAVMTALYGRVADLVGTRLPLLVGVSLMSLGAVVAACATSYGVLLVARLVQGSGAASVPALGLTVLSDRYDGQARRLALGRLAGVAAAVSCAGPLAGGVTERLLGWRAAFCLPVLGALIVPLVWGALTRRRTDAQLDLVGAALVTATAAGVVLMIQSPSSGAGVATAGGVLAGLGAPASALHTRRRPHGFLPLSVISHTGVRRVALSAAAVPAAWFSLLVAVPTALAGRGWEPWQVGVLLIPSAVVAALAPRAAGPLLVRLGYPRSVAVAAGMAATSLLLASWGAHGGSPLVLVAAVAVVSLAVGLGQPALSAYVGEAIAPEVRGIAMGVVTLVFLAGGSLGSAVVGGCADLVGLTGSLCVVALLPGAALALLLPALHRYPKEI